MPADGSCATIEGDYARARDLVGNLIAEGIEASVSDTIRETVEAAQALIDEGAAYLTPKALTEKLGVGRSAAYDRIRRTLHAGYLINQAARDERGMRLVVGATLPGSEISSRSAGGDRPAYVHVAVRTSFGSTAHESRGGVRAVRFVRRGGEEDEIKHLAALALQLPGGARNG